MLPPALQLDGVCLSYGNSFNLNATFTIPVGAHAALVGPSGSGKTTLLRLIAGLDSPQQGTVLIVGAPLGDANWRATHLGFVFQHFALLNYLTVRENILLPFRIAGHKPDATAHTRLNGLIDRAGLSGCVDRRPDQLSHGERQRVAVCRALIHQPTLILADEPTASLDPQTGQGIVDLLRTEATASGAALLMVTHDPSLLDTFDPVLRMQDLCG